jgi:predicted unusual protein kinase regulating ubiquinone biosynthesis (AarF/ABC1/UbiB family)
VEKLARYFMRTFKDNQLGKKGKNVKETVGADLQTLTENDVFRFPSTFTFIFRSFASIDGIGKGLSDKFDIGKLAQPFIEEFTEMQKGYENPAEKSFNLLAKATGLNQADIFKAISSPKKIAYIEETMRSMERGDLKIRVRSLENEKSLERMSLSQGKMEKLLIASLLLNLAGAATSRILRNASLLGAVAFGLKALIAGAKITKFDKTQLKYSQTKFVDD